MTDNVTDAVLPGTEVGWLIHFDVDATNRRVVESLAAICNGRFGTWGLLDHQGDLVPGSTVASGVYDSDAVPSLLEGPRWSVVELAGPNDWRETVELDLRTGVVSVELHGRDPATGGDRAELVRATLFASIARPSVHALRVEGPVGTIADCPALLVPELRPGLRIEAEETVDGTSCVTVTSDRGGITATATQALRNDEDRCTLTRFASYRRASDDDRGEAATIGGLDRVAAIGYTDLLAEHGRRWADRWAACAIDIPARPDLERAVRFAQYHLLAASTEDGEAAIGARGLTGRAYRGHVFWDTDVFVVPALSAMAPDLARSALRYRVNRLSAARRRAADESLAGARFPWESADTGFEVTPTEGRDLHGNVIPVLTGSQEEHIVADIAWAIMNHVAWSGDRRFLETGGAAVVYETARYWQSRIERDGDGSGHIRGVIGPDEYHEAVDDNTFTNAMARWNLETAAALAERSGGAPESERRAWADTAAALVDNYDPATGTHEQFTGFFDLEPVLVASIGTAPLPADALLGRERIHQIQIIKQPDVLMLHHLLPDALPPGSLDRDLDVYLPRTAHGSSLSPAITASALARVDRAADALHWFELAARLDLDDITGTTAGGLHMATMGGVWQALAHGFLGVRPTDEAVVVDPRVPDELGTVTLRFLWRSAPVRVDASAGGLEVSSPTDIAVDVPGLGRCRGRRIGAVRGDGGWEAT